MPTSKSTPKSFLFGMKLPDKTESSTGLRIDPLTGLVLPNPATQAAIAARKKLTEDTCCSFEEWKAVGYWVCKGAKSHFKDFLGTPQFTKEQVYKSR